MPKNKRLLKMLNETGVKQLVQRAELDCIADRKLPSRQQRMRGLEEALYFVLDEKGHSVHLTDKGAAALSPDDPTLFLVPDISEAVHAIERDPGLPGCRSSARQQVEAEYAAKSEKLHIIHKLLQAHSLYEKDVDYVVQDNQVMIVDEFTGRVMTGGAGPTACTRRWKPRKGCRSKGETQTLATITIQNYFRMFDKLAGMTGTAETEETRVLSDLRARSAVIPTNKPIRAQRSARPDLQDPAREVQRGERRDRAAARAGAARPDRHDLRRSSRKRSPGMLKRRGLEHEVLNAKYHEREAEIVAGAGQKGAVTIATNMAGRGTDIKLGQDLDLRPGGRAPRSSAPSGTNRAGSTASCAAAPAGRAIPGASLFFLSLEDDLMRLFGSDRIARYMDKTRRRGGRSHHRDAGDAGDRAGAKTGRAAELPVPEAAARVRRRDEPAARSCLFAPALLAGAGRGAKAEARQMIAMRAGSCGAEIPRRVRPPGGLGPQGAHRRP